MTRAPLVGLVGRRKIGSQIIGQPEVLGHIDIELFYRDYARGVIEAGGFAVNLPLDSDPAEAVSRCDGIVLSGGADIDPARYGHEPETDMFPPEQVRDSFEMAILDAASSLGTPVLGICRGLQMANVHGGGTLHQHNAMHSRFDVLPDTQVHEVAVTAGSTLGSVYGESRSVNSLHHQTVDEVAPDYRVTARSDDGTVEGLEHKSLPIIAVQWHPEMMQTRATDPVFAWLVEAATKFAPSRDA